MSSIDPKPQTIADILPAPLARLRLIILGSYTALLIYFVVLNVIAFDGFKLAAAFIWFLQAIPLLIFVRHLYATHLRTYGWLCFVVLLYFIHAVLVAFDPSRRILGIVEVTICTVLFIALLVFIRDFKEHFQVNM